MKWIQYTPGKVFVVSESTNPISSKLHIYREYGQLVGTIFISDDPEDFVIETYWTSYNPVINWVADENWRKMYEIDDGCVFSIDDLPHLDIKYDEE